jgi:hypothetical protein
VNKNMSKLTKTQKAEIEQAREELRTWLKPGMTIWTQLNHVSRSGMQRVISLKIVEGGEIRDISYKAAVAMERKLDNNYGGIKIGGCGMDMGFALVHNLGRSLYPKGFDCIGEGCEGNYHCNHGPEEEKEHHSDGGYAFKQRWT